jgi:hypothetical protein
LAQTHNEIGTYGSAHRPQQFNSKAQPVVQRASKFVVSPVGERRQELFREMTVAQEFATVQTTFLAAQCSRRVVLDDAIDIVLVHFLGEATMRRFAHARRCHNRKPVGHVPGCPAAKVRHLAHQAAIMPVDTF